MAAQFHHFGVPSNVQSADETYIEGGKVFVTDPDKHPFHVEFLRFEAGSPMPEVIQKGAHVAFLVPSLEEALQGQNVLLPPFDATAELRCAFIQDGNAVIEVMEKR